MTHGQGDWAKRLIEASTARASAASVRETWRTGHTPLYERDDEPWIGGSRRATAARGARSHAARTCQGGRGTLASQER